MDKQLVMRLKATIDGIAHHTEDGVEYWLARELQEVFGYSRWENFENALEKAKFSCKNSGTDIIECFRDITKTSPMPNGGVKEINDIMLTRYACYLIAQNGDSHKSEIAFAQSYFAVQTRKQEVLEQRLSDLNRLQLREQLRSSEKQLSKNIYERGVDEKGFGRIRSKGDKALFGYTTEEMKEKYGVKNRPLADFLPPVTVAAKNLATEMTNLNVEQKNLHGELPITNEHVQNHSSVRSMLGSRGIKPEALPPAEDIKKLERRITSEEKKLTRSNEKLTK